MHIFQPNNIASEFDMIDISQPINVTREKIWYFTPLEVAHKIYTNINSKIGTRPAILWHYSSYLYLEFYITYGMSPKAVQKGTNDY